ncbi:hypothetical protein ACVCIH_13210 [Burkholderia glumae]|uniref:hypothetical protein n=1 Tax=Burkholderia glumae TaxID=337 RepID=UPI000F5E8F56|nr:hypothetical protein [Burkholderia glumae]MCM2490863.1 hypothetical protein [Burkholderia glumae]MCR1766656.1 hypothetical protein [Burkholderia glumae]
MANDTSKGKDVQSEFMAAIAATVPQYYANGFGVGANATDVNLLFTNGEKGVAVVAVPYSSLKSLLPLLNGAIEDYEAATGAKIKTVQEIQRALQAVSDASKRGEK